MRSFAFGTLLLLAMTLSGHAQSTTHDQDIQKIIALEQEFDSLANKGNAEKLGAWIDKYVTDDFVCIYIDGTLVNKTATRADYVEMATNGVRIETTEQEVRVTGDTAVSTAVTHEAQKSDSGEAPDVVFRRMSVWIRLNGDWKMTGAAGAQVR